MKCWKFEWHESIFDLSGSALESLKWLVQGLNHPLGSTHVHSCMRRWGVKMRSANISHSALQLSNGICTVARAPTWASGGNFHWYLFFWPAIGEKNVFWTWIWIIREGSRGWYNVMSMIISDADHATQLICPAFQTNFVASYAGRE